MEVNADSRVLKVQCLTDLMVFVLITCVGSSMEVDEDSTSNGNNDLPTHLGKFIPLIVESLASAIGCIGLRDETKRRWQSIRPRRFQHDIEFLRHGCQKLRPHQCVREHRMVA